MEQILLSFLDYLKQFSYFGIVAALTFEFVPAELVLPLVGYWVHEGDLQFVWAVLAGTIGGTTGPLTLYALGYYGGRPLLEKYGRFLFIKQEQLDASDRFFAKHGSSVAFLGRFLPGVRTLISVPCGVARMNVWVFSVYTFLAMLPITALYVYIGMTLGEHWHDASAIAKQYMLPLAAGAVLILLVLLWKSRRRKQQK